MIFPEQSQKAYPQYFGLSMRVSYLKDLFSPAVKYVKI